MNGIGSGGPLQSYSTLPSTSPIGKPAVGLESTAHKDLPVAPVEALPAVARNESRQTAIEQALYSNRAAAPTPELINAVQARLAPSSPTTNTQADVPPKGPRAASGPVSSSTTAMKRRLAAAFDDQPVLGSNFDQRV